MPGKDLTRWIESDDGTWSRIVPDQHDQTVADDQPLDDEGYEEPVDEVEVEDEYDATTGAVEAAAKLGVDLSGVTGTGQGGRITKADVEAAANA